MVEAALRRMTDESVGASSRLAKSFPNFARAYGAEPARKWQMEIQDQLLECAKLPEDWDSYGSQPSGWDAGLFALSLLNDFMRPRTPIPQVVPSSAGGIQLEWHQKGVDLELHITGPYQCEVWFKDHRAPDQLPVSLELTDDYSALRRPFELLTNR
ncbi:hypothetical protein [Bradyrhizobium sp. SZCCHNR3003]|uniref:hypothetical protein n=1 Tax=Bradyrhizobium sp. SZCCHNR3003 TaxID=3057387 RepID=UPI00291689F7|nr:hypothetical protein [Bradyrhizobium sp. SZCCHNR3003]